MTTRKEQITLKAKEILADVPAGVRFSDLVSRLQQEFPNVPYGTITGTVWNLDTRFPTEIYKPSRGLFRLIRFRSEPAPVAPEPVAETPAGPGRLREVDFYQPFADYVVNDLEECTRAIPLGGNRFGSKWGTPDVFGILRSRESDIFKAPLEVVVVSMRCV